MNNIDPDADRGCGRAADAAAHRGSTRRDGGGVARRHRVLLRDRSEPRTVTFITDTRRTTERHCSVLFLNSDRSRHPTERHYM